jgi:hypothetical protein
MWYHVPLEYGSRYDWCMVVHGPHMTHMYPPPHMTLTGVWWYMVLT